MPVFGQGTKEPGVIAAFEASGTSEAATQTAQGVIGPVTAVLAWSESREGV